MHTESPVSSCLTRRNRGVNPFVSVTVTVVVVSGASPGWNDLLSLTLPPLLVLLPELTPFHPSEYSFLHLVDALSSLTTSRLWVRVVLYRYRDLTFTPGVGAVGRLGGGGSQS